MIDAENLSVKYVAQLIAACSQRGQLCYRRAYGNWSKPSLSSWETIFRQHAIEAIQQFDFTKGKNATDIALTIDAMDILHRQEVDAFCLASNDSDFTPLVLRLRQSGLVVYGCGYAQASQAFQEACSEFIPLKSPKATATQPTPATAVPLQLVPELPSQTPIPGKQIKQDTKFMNVLRRTIEATTDETGWAMFSVFTQKLRSHGYAPKQFGYAKWLKLLTAIDIIETKRGKKNCLVLRIRPKSQSA